MPTSTVLLLLLVSLLLGAFVTWLLLRSSSRPGDEAGASGEARDRIARLEERLAAAEALRSRVEQSEREREAAVVSVAREKAAAEAVRGERDRLVRESEQLRSQLSAERTRHEAQLAEVTGRHETERGRMMAASEERIRRLTETLSEREAKVAELATQLEAERQHGPQALALLERQREATAQQFKELAAQVLEERAKAFTESNQSHVEVVLKPFREQLEVFQKRVDHVYDIEGKERAALGEQVRQLMALNQQMSAEARQLTDALKGNTRTQGAWGEVLLERILEVGGLKRDIHFRTQVSSTHESGTRVRPDVVIELPQGRRLVVDSKVSLVDFERYTAASTESERDAAAQRHVASVRQHVDGLKSREYEGVDALSSFDFVVMFVPLEPAFLLAVSRDPGLWEWAWQRNVLLVSPSTLLFVVRTVAHLWKTEDQHRNAIDIARQGGRLYDKLVLATESIRNIGKELEQARTAYDQATSRLFDGRGNVLVQAEKLKQLGAATTKSLPRELTLRLDVEGEEDVDVEE